MSSSLDFAQDFAEQVVEKFGEERMYACFECGQCAACCPVRRVNGRFSPRRIIHMILLGMMDDLFNSNSLWLCTTCYTCQEICPQGIKIADLLVSVRNMAYEQGYAPSGIQKQAELIRSQGRLYALDEFDDRKRKKANLPSLAGTIDEVVKLLEEQK